MKKRWTETCLILTLCAFFSGTVAALDLGACPGGDHAECWNQFAGDVYRLHLKLIDGKDLEEKEKIGGYAGYPAFYRQVEYFDRDTGRKLSVIQWEREQPDRVHWIEVYVYDDQGRIIRDFSASFLPFSRSAPQATYINLHAYEGDLHAFRQFDATGVRLYEFCRGSYNGEKVGLAVLEDDILDMKYGDSDLASDPVYQTCFKNLPLKPGDYVRPH